MTSITSEGGPTGPPLAVKRPPDLCELDCEDDPSDLGLNGCQASDGFRLSRGSSRLAVGL